MSKGDENVSRWALNFVIVAVVTVWAGAYVTNIIDRDFVPPRGLTEAMLGVAGVAFASKKLMSKSGGDEKSPED